jgi:CO/xanthine dehydrogenase FAD-binding subunit
MENFEYFEPKTLKEAIGKLVKYKRGAKLLAGGTDLMVEMKTGLVKPKYLINLKKIKGLNKINFSKKEGLTIGSLVTWTNILSSKSIQQYYPILREAASFIACNQIRNIATIGGNICHASPSADSAPPLMIYEAQCMIAGPGRKRVIPIEDLFTGVQKISLKAGEILTGFRLPLPDKESRGCYLKFALRNAMGLPVVGVGVLVTTSNGTFKEVKIALGAVALTPIRARKAEGFLLGKPVNKESIDKAAEEAMKESEPITDIRASREYRLDLVKELTSRAIRISISKNTTSE